MELATQSKSKRAVEYLISFENQTLKKLPNLVANLSKEKKQTTGQTADLNDKRYHRVITDKNIRELLEEVDWTCKKIIANQLGTNAYFKRMTFQEMHIALFLKALLLHDTLHSTIHSDPVINQHKVKILNT